MLTTGWKLYTNVSNIGYKALARTKIMGDHHITTQSTIQETK